MFDGVVREKFVFLLASAYRVSWLSGDAMNKYQELLILLPIAMANNLINFFGNILADIKKPARWWWQA